MRLYGPSTLTPDELLESNKDFNERVEQVGITDDLRAYVGGFFAGYRTTLERFFPAVTPYLWLYHEAPFETFILRVGPQGVIIGHRPAGEPALHVQRPEDLDPPLELVNVFDVARRWPTPFCSFDFSIRRYDQAEAERRGIQLALQDALMLFWHVLEADQFSELCLALLRAAGVVAQVEGAPGTVARYDAAAEVLLAEPAGFRRGERWAFLFKHDRSDWLSASALRAIAANLERAGDPPDVVCLLTSGDLTSVGNAIAVDHPRIRVWDRPVLDQLINDHLDIVAPYFPAYLSAVEQLAEQVARLPETIAATRQSDNLAARLRACPRGQQHFSQYEEIGTAIWEHLFQPALGGGQRQRRTEDGAQRRDVLFPNRRGGRFWRRIADDHRAKFVIVDFKNYTDPIDAGIVDDVSRYANKALGDFIVVVSREGADQSADKARRRAYRDRDVILLVVSDAQLLEMLARKAGGEAPEDLLDEFLIAY